MSNLVAKDATARLRLIPPGKDRLPWYGAGKKYPWIGYPAFWDEMTEAERDNLYEVYQEEGLDALHDAVLYLSRTVWFSRRLRRTEAEAERGRKLLEGR